MRKLPTILAAISVLAACSPSAPPQTEAPTPPPAVAACNDLAPDLARLVSVQDEAAAALPAAELRGGRIAPGSYDLVRAVRIGEATGWSDERAVVLMIAESDAGLVLNWAGAALDGTIDTWTATLSETPQVRISYICGRMGTVAAGFTAQADALDLSITDGAAGSLYMVFQRRS